jgi:hypothetical protein
MAMEYKMIDKVTLKNFKRFMRSGIPLREFGPQGAFDSKPRARDDEPDDKPAPSAIAGMIALRDRMSPEGFRALCNELCGGEAEDGDPASQFTDPMDREMHQKAQDEPPPFKGRPRTGGAMDAMAFDKLSTPRRSKAEKSFAAMFGEHAADIKTSSDPYPTMSRTRT